MTPDEKLVYMANQISEFFAAQGEDRAVKSTADHLQRFWDPQMRRSFVALAARDPSKLLPIVRKALPLLKEYVAGR